MLHFNPTNCKAFLCSLCPPIPTKQSELIQEQNKKVHLKLELKITVSLLHPTQKNWNGYKKGPFCTMERT